MSFPGSSAGKESACSAGDPGSIPGLGRSPGEGIGYPIQYSWAFLMAQTGFNPLVRKILFWVGKASWRRAWQPTPVFLPGESHGQRSLAGYSTWGHKESDTTKHIIFPFNILYGPTVTSAHEYWENHSFDYVDLCQQSDMSAF